jgi:TetR/AcrR family transcriptional repressor of bet genes
VRICRDLVNRGAYTAVDAESVAIGLAGLIEYLWQEIMVAGRRFDRGRARQTVRSYLASIFPNHFTAGP